MAFVVTDLHDASAPRDGLLELNNASARETSLLPSEKFEQMIAAASVATYVQPAAGLLLAFQHSDAYDGGHFLWFRQRYARFLYIDRIVVGAAHRNDGVGRLLYADLFARAASLGQDVVVCEVNVEPPNPVSEKFHERQCFTEVGRATIESGAKTVRYLLKRL